MPNTISFKGRADNNINSKGRGRKKRLDQTVTNNDNSSSNLIQCPRCKTSITVEDLGEHINANPETKKQAIEEQLQLWGEAYDREYLIQNVVLCPKCSRVTHLGDWTTTDTTTTS